MDYPVQPGPPWVDYLMR